jgi:RNA polymerase sigma factor (sigma-70 family)
VRFARRCGLQLSDAEDVRQMVMVRMARILRELRYSRERGRFRSLLGRVTRNEISRHLSSPGGRVRRVSNMEGAAEPVDDAADAGPAWRQEWVYHHLRRAMAEVRSICDGRSLDVFERLLAGEPPESVASAMSMTVAAVHKVKQRIRDRLREIVSRQIREEDEGGE